MKRLPILLFFIFLQQIVVAQSYKKIHQNAILVDTHNDILMKVVDLQEPLPELSGEADAA